MNAYEFPDLNITILRQPYNIIWPYVLIDRELGERKNIGIDDMPEEIARMYAEAWREKQNRMKPDWWNWW